MKTNKSNSNELMNKTYVRFHVGRGGRFHNAGYKTFEGFDTIQDVLRSDDSVFYYSEDEEGRPLPIADCKICHNDTILFEGQEAYDIINGTKLDGVAEYDGEYNTDIVRTLDDLRDDEIEILAEQILAGALTAWCDRKDEVVRYIAANSDSIREKYSGSVATFNADAFCVETDEQIGDVALSAFNDSLEELDEDDKEEWQDALAKLDLTSVSHIYTNDDMLICFEGDY